MPFGQLVIGPPGSGKSTYCDGMLQFLNAIGRKATVVNLDPANDRLPYRAAVDIRDFITLEEIMESQQLGPNGGVLYAMDELALQIDSVLAQLQRLGKHEYFLFDCPGQVELFTHHPALSRVFRTLEKELGFRLVVVNLSDSVYLSQPSQYISVVLLALRTMLQFNLPQINVLSKIDLLAARGPLPFRLEYYTEVQDLNYLVEHEQEAAAGGAGAVVGSGVGGGRRLAKLTERIAEMVADFGLVEFQVLAVENKRSMIALLNVIDKASGYLFGSTEIGGDSLWVEATRQGGLFDVDVHDRWIANKQFWDEKEAEEDLQRAARAADEWPVDEFDGIKAERR